MMLAIILINSLVSLSNGTNLFSDTNSEAIINLNQSVASRQVKSHLRQQRRSLKSKVKNIDFEFLMREF